MEVSYRYRGVHCSIHASASLVNKGYNRPELLTVQRLQNVRGTWLQGSPTSFSQGRLYWAKRPWYHNPFMAPARPAHAANCPASSTDEKPLVFASHSHLILHLHRLHPHLNYQ
jgi:hypothetical protein